MLVNKLWENDLEFRKIATSYFLKFEQEMQDIDQRYDSWGGFKYKSWWYDLHLFSDEDGVRDCIYGVKINCKGDLETDFENELVIPKIYKKDLIQ